MTQSSLVTKLKNLYIYLATNERYDIYFIIFLLVMESILGALIIKYVPYTEIDWTAYMEEVDGWLVDGHYDYKKISGNTGPLVYPAGFLYVFAMLQWLTNRHVPTAQIYFLIFYICIQSVVMMLYYFVLKEIRKNNKFQMVNKGGNSSNNNGRGDSRVLDMANTIWSFRIAMGCLCLSKRHHSIFLLRLFNDGPTMLITYISFYCFVTKRWNVGCLFYSLAVSMKMNILLFAPGLLYLLIQESVSMTIPRLAICGITQVVLGGPFLLYHPVSYLRKAFELDRQFFYKWTVNFKFLSERTFLSKELAIFLLILHLSCLGIYFCRLHKLNRNMSSEHILSTLFVSNFIGICCARTIHYQFYSWYVSAIPYILWRETSNIYPFIVRLLLLAVIEYSYLTFPATSVSSSLLQISHWMILIPCIIWPQSHTSSTSTGTGTSLLSKIKGGKQK